MNHSYICKIASLEEMDDQAAMQAVLSIVHFEPRDVQNRDCVEVVKILFGRNS